MYRIRLQMDVGVRVVWTSAAGSKAEKHGVKMDYVAVHAKEGS